MNPTSQQGINLDTIINNLHEGLGNENHLEPLQDKEYPDKEKVKRSTGVVKPPTRLKT